MMDQVMPPSTSALVQSSATTLLLAALPETIVVEYYQIVSLMNFAVEWAGPSFNRMALGGSYITPLSCARHDK